MALMSGDLFIFSSKINKSCVTLLLSDSVTARI